MSTTKKKQVELSSKLTNQLNIRAKEWCKIDGQHDANFRGMLEDIGYKEGMTEFKIDTLEYPQIKATFIARVADAKREDYSYITNEDLLTEELFREGKKAWDGFTKFCREFKEAEIWYPGKHDQKAKLVKKTAFDKKLDSYSDRFDVVIATAKLLKKLIIAQLVEVHQKKRKAVDPMLLNMLTDMEKLPNDLKLYEEGENAKIRMQKEEAQNGG